MLNLTITSLVFVLGLFSAFLYAEEYHEDGSVWTTGGFYSSSVPQSINGYSIPSYEHRPQVMISPGDPDYHYKKWVKSITDKIESGKAYMDKKEWRQAADTFEKANDECLQIEGNKNLAEAGNELKENNERKDPLIKFLSDINFEEIQGEVYFNLAVCYGELDKVEDSSWYHKKYLSYGMSGYKSALSHFLLGNIYYKTQRYQKAQESLLESEKLCQSLGMKKELRQVRILRNTVSKEIAKASQ